MHMTGIIALNEDDSHYFMSRAGQNLDVETVDSWVDQYADTQVKLLILNANAMRTSYDSDVWDPMWKGYDPEAGDDQPFFAGIKDPEEIKAMRKWVHTNWKLYADGIDVYERWIGRCRQKGITPWISVRMNDVHCVDNPDHFMHSTFWRENPQFRRIPGRMVNWSDHAFDYGNPEVREYQMKLIRELLERYDFDGMELDWMRFGYHLKPGHEAEGVAILNEFTADVRRLLDEWEKKCGHKISLGARVPTNPQTARWMGMDAVTWAKQGLIDMLVATPFFSTIDTDMPMEMWKQLLEGTDVTLAAGLEILVNPYPGYVFKNEESIFTHHTNSIETVRGAAVSALERGADIIYLFNYMDSETAMDDMSTYNELLSSVGKLETMAGKPRRHILTYADTWAPGDPLRAALPAELKADEWREFRLHIGPKPESGEAVLVLGVEEGDVSADTLSVFINTEPVTFSGPVDLPMPHPGFSTYEFKIPLSAMVDGYNIIMLTSKSAIKIGWVEIDIRP